MFLVSKIIKKIKHLSNTDRKRLIGKCKCFLLNAELLFTEKERSQYIQVWNMCEYIQREIIIYSSCLVMFFIHSLSCQDGIKKRPIT